MLCGESKLMDYDVGRKQIVTKPVMRIENIYILKQPFYYASQFIGKGLEFKN